MYHTVARDGGKLDRTPVGHNRKRAERELTKLQASIDDDTYQRIQNKPFNTWADEWLASLKRPKENTRRSYVSTLGYAKEAFGSKQVRKIGAPDIDRFLALMNKTSASTQAKHLRVLHACLSAAVRRGYASRNAVELLGDSQKPRPGKRESAYFENDELPRLFGALPDDGVYRAVCLTALKTGMRRGELLGLTWGDVDLTAAVIRVRRTFTAGHVTEPKNHERRDVDLTPEVVDLLGAWWGEQGKPGDDQLVFPDPLGGHLHPEALLRSVLYPAMKRAAVARVGPTGEKRTFHSFRHTFAKVAMENGRQVTWLSRHLGHSSVQVTTGVYGHWERATRQAEAGKMAGVFTV
jgi:integrase